MAAYLDTAAAMVNDVMMCVLASNVVTCLVVWLSIIILPYYAKGLGGKFDNPDLKERINTLKRAHKIQFFVRSTNFVVHKSKIGAHKIKRLAHKLNVSVRKINLRRNYAGDLLYYGVH